MNIASQKAVSLAFQKIEYFLTLYLSIERKEYLEMEMAPSLK